MADLKERLNEIREQFGSAIIGFGGLIDDLCEKAEGVRVWTSVNDDTPNRHPEMLLDEYTTVNVLVVEEDNETHARSVAIANMSSLVLDIELDDWIWICSVHHEVVYWMPLPQLPKEKEGA